MNATNQQRTKAAKSNEHLRGTVLRQLAALAKMKTPELREKWRELNGTEPPAYKRQHLVRRLAYRIQEMYYGGLEDRAQQHLAELAETDALALVTGKPKKKTPATQLVPGTRLKRRWRGVEYEVVVVEGGFRYKGTVYKSLTAAAEAITGMKLSGRNFFGLPKLKSAKRESRDA
jgi:hypothetical protein